MIQSNLAWKGIKIHPQDLGLLVVKDRHLFGWVEIPKGWLLVGCSMICQVLLRQGMMISCWFSPLTVYGLGYPPQYISFLWSTWSTSELLWFSDDQLEDMGGWTVGWSFRLLRHKNRSENCYKLHLVYHSDICFTHLHNTNCFAMCPCRKDSNI